MILADVHHRLTRSDAQLVLRVVGRGSDAEYRDAESRLREEGIDALLDDPRLLTGLLETRPAVPASYVLFLYVVVRHACLSLNLSDRVVADYVASVLMHFGERDRPARIAWSDDQLYDTLAGLAADVDASDPRRGFLTRVHMGNYALWLSGIFPDYVEHRRHRRGGPDLDYYETMGRKGFALAAEHRLANEYGVTRLFVTVANDFVRLRMALNSISDTLLFPHSHSPGRVLRQVSNQVRQRELP